MMIRRAVREDIPGLNETLRQVNLVHHNGRPDLFRYQTRKYSDEELEELIVDDTRPVFVAVDEQGKVLAHAFCIFQQHINNSILTDVKTLYIDDICVLEEYRGQHIGRQMYDHVYAFAKSQGFYNITLNVWALNPTAIRFYESCGLKPQKIGMETIL
jgi:ribosomal protein S18 acetylase RimI-like enzyme